MEPIYKIKELTEESSKMRFSIRVAVPVRVAEQLGGCECQCGSSVFVFSSLRIASSPFRSPLPLSSLSSLVVCSLSSLNSLCSLSSLNSLSSHPGRRRRRLHPTASGSSGFSRRAVNDQIPHRESF